MVRVAEVVLMDLYDITKQILIDQETNFTDSNLNRKTLRTHQNQNIHLNQSITEKPYHTQTNGLVEGLNKILPIEPQILVLPTEKSTYMGSAL